MFAPPAMVSSADLLTSNLARAGMLGTRAIRPRRAPIRSQISTILINSFTFFDPLFKDSITLRPVKDTPPQGTDCTPKRELNPKSRLSTGPAAACSIF